MPYEFACKGVLKHQHADVSTAQPALREKLIKLLMESLKTHPSYLYTSKPLNSSPSLIGSPNHSLNMITSWACRWRSQQKGNKSRFTVGNSVVRYILERIKSSNKECQECEIGVEWRRLTWAVMGYTEQNSSWWGCCRSCRGCSCLCLVWKTMTL